MNNTDTQRLPTPEPHDETSAGNGPELAAPSAQSSVRGLFSLDRALAAGLTLLGAAIAVSGYSSGGFQEATALQIILGTVVFICSLLTVLKPPVRKVAASVDPADLRANPRIRWRPEYSIPAVFFGLTAGYIVAITLTDFLWGTLLFGTIYLWVLFRFHFFKALLVAGAVAVSAYLLFVELLGVPFS